MFPIRINFRLHFFYISMQTLHPLWLSFSLPIQNLCESVTLVFSVSSSLTLFSPWELLLLLLPCLPRVVRISGRRRADPSASRRRRRRPTATAPTSASPAASASSTLYSLGLAHPSAPASSSSPAPWPATPDPVHLYSFSF